jgi:hypothetical protein
MKKRSALNVITKSLNSTKFVILALILFSEAMGLACVVIYQESKFRRALEDIRKFESVESMSAINESWDPWGDSYKISTDEGGKKFDVYSSGGASSENTIIKKDTFFVKWLINKNNSIYFIIALIVITIGVIIYFALIGSAKAPYLGSGVAF